MFGIFTMAIQSAVSKRDVQMDRRPSYIQPVNKNNLLPNLYRIFSICTRPNTLQLETFWA